MKRKYIKINEKSLSKGIEDKFSTFDKFRHSIISDPDYEKYTYVAVYVENKFVENEDGSYTKEYNPLTAILEITPDRPSFTNINMMNFRGRHQNNEGIMIVQKVDKDVAEDMIESITNRDEMSQFYLKTLVDHYLKHNKNAGRR